jgi:hypothetical protein
MLSTAETVRWHENMATFSEKGCIMDILLLRTCLLACPAIYGIHPFEKHYTLTPVHTERIHHNSIVDLWIIVNFITITGSLHSCLYYIILLVTAKMAMMKTIDRSWDDDGCCCISIDDAVLMDPGGFATQRARRTAYSMCTEYPERGVKTNDEMWVVRRRMGVGAAIEQPRRRRGTTAAGRRASEHPWKTCTLMNVYLV